MDIPIDFTGRELDLIGDGSFFREKAQIMKKVRAFLDQLCMRLREDLQGVSLLVPPGFNPENRQFVKGEHLEDRPYQYLDFPKHFLGDDKFTFRSMFWWGHHFVFALILEGEGLSRYKRNLVSRFHTIAGHELSLCLSPSLWEWKQGEGYTMPIRHDRKSEVAAVLSSRRSFKIGRFVVPDDQLVKEGRLVEVGREAFRAVLPIITT